MRLLTALAVSAAGFAQTPAPADFKPPSAFLHHVQGETSINGSAVDEIRFGMKVGKYPELGKGDVLRTGLGLAEVLLSPGMSARLGEHTELRMIQPGGPVVEIELVSGSVAVEAIDVKTKSLVVRHKEFAAAVKKPGALRLGASPAELRVYDGVAELTFVKGRREVKKGYAVTLDAMTAMSKFDLSQSDALVRWSLRRSQTLSLASIGSAMALRTARAPWSGASWFFNPYFGAWTFIPDRDLYLCGGWGLCYYGPNRVQHWYQRQRQAAQVVPAPVPAAATHVPWNASTSATTETQRTYEAQPAPPPQTPPASVDTSSRGGESAGSRGSEGGGRSQ